MHALILAGGDGSTRAGLDATWPGWQQGIELVIAADGGARHAGLLDLRIDLWVGDGDSIDPELLADLERTGVAVERADRDKDESDTELAVTAALARGATRLSIVGALGGSRLDHALANVALLAMPDLRGLDVRLLADDNRIRSLRAPLAGGAIATMPLDGRVGDRVSLLPVGGPAIGVTTDGLRYPLHDEPLIEGRTRGLSNVREGASASVSARSGTLLVVESPARL